MRLLLVVLLLVTPVAGFAGYIVVDANKAKNQKINEQMITTELSVEEKQFRHVEAACRSQLSPGGTLRYDDAEKALFVHDIPSVANLIRTIATSKKLPANTIQLDVLFDNQQDLSSVDWKKRSGSNSRGSVTIKGGRFGLQRGIDIEIPLDEVGNSQYGRNQKITTKNGIPQTLWNGKGTTPPRWLNSLIAKGTSEADPQTSLHINEEQMFVDVVSSLRVKATTLENGMYIVEVYPEISFKNEDGIQTSCVLRSLRNVQAVTSGQRINVGGIVKKDSKTYKQLFGSLIYRRDENRNIFDMFLRATTVE